MIYRYKNYLPEIDSSAFIAPSADVIGRIKIGRDASLWFNVTARADVHHIEIGWESNVQDNSMLHVTNNVYPLYIGNRVTIGHSVTMHGCRINDNTLVGMSAVILDGAEIGEFSIVAAGALVREGQKFPPGVLIAGFPAVVKRELTQAEKEKNLKYAANYVAYKNTYRDSTEFGLVNP
jgi:carbonic anhydrase/acetyltransferase-like protein (isoleucine patch superfamily)